MITSNGSSWCPVNKRRFRSERDTLPWQQRLYCSLSLSPPAFQPALFRPLIDQRALGEFSYSDAPQHAADECPSGTRPFSHFESHESLNTGLKRQCNVCNLKKKVIRASYHPGPCSPAALLLFPFLSCRSVVTNASTEEALPYFAICSLVLHSFLVGPAKISVFTRHCESHLGKARMRQSCRKCFITAEANFAPA